MRTLLLFALFAAPLSAQNPVRIQIPVEVLQEALTVHDTTVVTVDVNVALSANELYQAGADAAMAALGGEVEDERHVLLRILESRTVQNVAILGASLILANAIRKRGDDITVEGDDIDVEVVVPPYHHHHKKKKKPWGGDDG